MNRERAATGPNLGEDWFEVDQGFLLFADGLRPWRHGDDDPIRDRFAGDDTPHSRPLRIYTQDPSASSMMGNVATIELCFEPLMPGPRRPLDRGVRSRQPCRSPAPASGSRESLRAAERRPLALSRRYRLSPADDLCRGNAHVGGVQGGVGARSRLGFRPPPNGRLRLRIRPHAFRDSNAYYDPDGGELLFGYYDSEGPVTGRNRRGGRVYTCLAHDIIAHETTHALLDGMRRHFFVPSNPEVLAFHGAFADLVAVLLRFGYPCVVDAAIASSGPGEKIRHILLTAIATQFGQTTGMNGPLRSAVANEASGQEVKMFDTSLPPHQLGAVLLQAVFEAFNTVFERKTRRIRDLAERYRPSPGSMDPTLASLLADEARKLARQFLYIVIRSIDYCPPVDITFGDFLRAMITADADLVPEDPYGYRDALIDAFARREIAPRDAPNLAEDVLLWNPPRIDKLKISGLHFENLRLGGDPRRAPPYDELERQARELGRFVIRRENAAEFGLALPGEEELEEDRVDPPCIAREQHRSARSEAA